MLKKNGDTGYLSMNNKPKGLQRLTISNNNIRLELNARILNENYKEGISLNTIDQLRQVLKNYGIELYQDFVKDAKLSLVHIKNDFEIDFHNLLNELMLVENNKYFKVKRDNSITFESKNKTDKMNTIFYGKHSEILSNKSKYSNLPIDINNFIGVTRMETRYNDWRTVNKYLGTRNMNEILNQNNINYITLSNILKDLPLKTNKLDLSRFKTISELDDYARAKLLNEQFDGNYMAMVNELKNLLGANTKVTYQANKLKKYLPLVKNPEGRKLEGILRLKDELINQ